VHRYRDWNDNLTHHFTITKFHDRIAVSSRSLVHTQPLGAPIGALTDRPASATLPYMLRDFLEFGGPVKLSPGLRAAHRSIGLAPTAPLGEQVQALGAYIHERFEYRKNVTSYDSTTEDFLKIGAGVCQDFAHLMLGLLRLRQIPCRYVSGYLHIERKKREPAEPRVDRALLGDFRLGSPSTRRTTARWTSATSSWATAANYDDVPPNKGIFRGIAKETLKAEIFTEVVPGKVVSTLREEISHIDLPVFREIPGRPPDRIVTGVADVGLSSSNSSSSRPASAGPTLRHLALDPAASAREGRAPGGRPRARRRSP